jgi:hypothetical protein
MGVTETQNLVTRIFHLYLDPEYYLNVELVEVLQQGWWETVEERSFLWGTWLQDSCQYLPILMDEEEVAATSP